MRSQIKWAVCIRQNPSTIDVSVQNSNGHREDVRDVVILHATHPVLVGDSGLLIRLPSQRKLFIANPVTSNSPSSRSLGSVFSGTITKLWYQDVPGTSGADIPVLAEVRLIHNPDVIILADIPASSSATGGHTVAQDVSLFGSMTSFPLSVVLDGGSDGNPLQVGRRVWVARDSGIAVWRLNAIEPYPARHVIIAVMQPEDAYMDTTPDWPTGYDNPYQYGKPTGIVSLADLTVTGTAGLFPGFTDDQFVYDLRC